MHPKYLSMNKVSDLCEEYRKEGKTIVFTNGCFDIVHAGHVKYLTQAASLGDVLILGLNSDASVRQIKGEKRPVISQEHRVQVICALECVDHVVLFDQPDPRHLIMAVCPDVLVKGADWEEDQIVGADFVKAHGGQIHRITLEPDISTTTIIQRILKLYNDG